MALTGEQISSSDALYLDLVDYHVPSAHFAELQASLIAAPDLNYVEIRKIIGTFITHPAESQLKTQIEQINQHFAYPSVEEIENSLAHDSKSLDRTWAQQTLSILKQRPIMAKTSLKLQQIGQNLSLEKCMQLERVLQDLWFEQGDLIEGVRALIIDKDKNPQWQQDNSKFDLILDKIWLSWHKTSTENSYAFKC